VTGYVICLDADMRPDEMQDHRLPHSTMAAPMARRLAEEAAASTIPGRVDAFVLLVCEAVTNAVLHAPPAPDGRIGLRFEARERVLRGVVTDGGSWFDSDAVTVHDGDGGLHLGMKIIDAVSNRWGISLDGVKTVWFEVEAAAS
jgi:anti-sigma regulatory factor (Ser/Thr protein kinase)